MAELCRCEDGITPTVKTLFSSYCLQDIVDQITIKKITALLTWIAATGEMPKTCLIIGTYLTGAKLANTLVKTATVTVIDKYPHIRQFLDPAVSFATSLDEVPADRWDLIMDTTGLGGIALSDLKRLECPSIFLVEDPCSDGSDTTILRVNQCFSLVTGIKASRKGVLFTGGLKTKTSGTMTLLMEVLQRSIRDANCLEGVLYSTASCEHYERILFKEQNYDAFVKGLKRPALIVSSLEPVNCDEVVDTHITAISSNIIDFSEHPA